MCWRPLPQFTHNLIKNGDKEDGSGLIPGFSLLTTGPYKQNVIKVTISNQWEKNGCFNNSKLVLQKLGQLQKGVNAPANFIHKKEQN